MMIKRISQIVTGMMLSYLVSFGVAQEDAPAVVPQDGQTEVTLGISSRMTDPFGLPPKAPLNTPPGPRDAAEAASIAAIKEVEPTAALALANLTIDGIDAGEREFFTSSRNIYEGDQFTLAFMGRTFTVDVITVLPDSITFQCVDTGERSTVHLGIVPLEDSLPQMEAP